MQSAFVGTKQSTPRNVYLYEFSMAPTWGAALQFSLGATHGAEIPYVMGTGMPFFTTDDERALSQVLMSTWVQFAATGNPSNDWQPYDPVNEAMAVFGPGNATTLSVPPGQNVVFTSFPKTGCLYLEPNATAPACLESPPAPPLPPLPPPLPMPNLPKPPPPPKGNSTSAASLPAAQSSSRLLVAVMILSALHLALF